MSAECLGVYCRYCISNQFKPYGNEVLGLGTSDFWDLMVKTVGLDVANSVFYDVTVWYAHMYRSCWDPSTYHTYVRDLVRTYRGLPVQAEKKSLAQSEFLQD